MATKTSMTASEAHAEILLSRSHKWAEGVEPSTGRAFYLFTSSKTDRDGAPVIYRTARDGSGCTCKSYWYRGSCCHSIAASRAAEQAREKVGYRRGYRDLFPSDEYDQPLTDAF